MSKHAQSVTARIDYVKFLVEMEFDRAQQVFRTLKGAMSQEGCSLVEGKGGNLKIRALGATETGKARRYSVESWGPHCIELAALVPQDWFEHLTRVDYREPLLHTQPADFDAYVTQTHMGQKGRRNVTTFNNKYRTKTDTRDVGGKGMFIGSRKSAHMSAAYQRADEAPCFETRHINRAAKDIGLQVLQSIDEGGPNEWYDGLMASVILAHHGELYQATGCHNSIALENAIVKAGKQMREMQAAMEWTATQAEEDYYRDLTTNQQTDLQAERYALTDKGVTHTK